ncbi:hypothetical protein BCR34DRAFT_588160 [Clohesyomyces aquaticus]|uniref:Uncharacterized protein n=1 Tax=Clohesyomyces aquaticus TaxID=1231657 RepID=A0A1Y1ZL89_9PLEO|nr:hypothetical protein BCR34DRAFT_588160 [Clohesyomyces aquaticus]
MSRLQTRPSAHKSQRLAHAAILVQSAGLDRAGAGGEHTTAPGARVLPLSPALMSPKQAAEAICGATAGCGRWRLPTHVCLRSAARDRGPGIPVDPICCATRRAESSFVEPLRWEEQQRPSMCDTITRRDPRASLFPEEMNERVRAASYPVSPALRVSRAGSLTLVRAALHWQLPPPSISYDMASPVTMGNGEHSRAAEKQKIHSTHAVKCTTVAAQFVFVVTSSRPDSHCRRPVPVAPHAGPWTELLDSGVHHQNRFRYPALGITEPLAGDCSALTLTPGPMAVS